MNDLTKDMHHCIDRQFPKSTLNFRENLELTNEAMKKERFPKELQIRELKSEKSGYIQTIDYEKIIAIAKKHDLTIKLNYEPGEFIFYQLKIAEIAYEENYQEKVESEIRECLQLGVGRSTTQDVKFSFVQIVDVAVRALSPGINDPYTAISCLNCMAEGLSSLSQRSMQPLVYYDDKNKLRLSIKSFDYESTLSVCFNQIRLYASTNIAVNLRILEIIRDVLSLSPPDTVKNALLTHARLVLSQCKHNSDLIEEDIYDIQSLYDTIEK